MSQAWVTNCKTCGVEVLYRGPIPGIQYNPKYKPTDCKEHKKEIVMETPEQKKKRLEREAEETRRRNDTTTTDLINTVMAATHDYSTPTYDSTPSYDSGSSYDSSCGSDSGSSSSGCD